jgi:hypothetical protein
MRERVMTVANVALFIFFVLFFIGLCMLIKEYRVYQNLRKSLERRRIAGEAGEATEVEFPKPYTYREAAREAVDFERWNEKELTVEFPKKYEYKQAASLGGRDARKLAQEKETRENIAKYLGAKPIMDVAKEETGEEGNPSVERENSSGQQELGE